MAKEIFLASNCPFVPWGRLSLGKNIMKFSPSLNRPYGTSWQNLSDTVLSFIEFLIGTVKSK